MTKNIILNETPVMFGVNEITEAHKRFTNYITKLFGNHYDGPKGLYLEFSDKEKRKSYGKYTKRKIINIIVNEYHVSDVIIDKIKKCLDGNNDFYINAIARDIVNECHYPLDRYKGIRQQLENLFGQVKYTSSILGEYCHRDRKIILYNKAIKSRRIKGASLTQKYESVFIHELFHAYHYYASNTESINLMYKELEDRHDYTASIIKESFATYFERQYCEYYSIPYDGMKYWGKSVSICPCAGVFNIYDDSDFIELFKISLRDCDKTLRQLLPPIDFFNIKNQ